MNFLDPEYRDHWFECYLYHAGDTDSAWTWEKVAGLCDDMMAPFVRRLEEARKMDRRDNE
jgi:hypothetical protein